VVVRSVDDNQTVVGIPGRIVTKKTNDTDTFDSYAASSSGRSNDPTVQAVDSIIERLAEIDKQMSKLSNNSEGLQIDSEELENK
jgi:serine O-acetyltransferase